MPDLKCQLREICNTETRDAFEKELEDAQYQSNSSKFADLVRRFSGKRLYRPPNQPISFQGKIHTKRPAIAKRFNKQFTSIGPHKHLHVTRRILRKIRKKKLVQDFNPIDENAVIAAIRRAKNSSAAGPDGITMVHLKHLGRRSLSYLTSLFNLSLRKSELPSIWKQALILPVPKPGKPPLISTSYRPISLLCPASKILERCVLPLLSPALSPSPSQHGFRSGHSTVTALLPTANRIANGFNEPKPPLRTATIAIDISKAFDAVQHSLLLDAICETDLHPNLVHWLATYLRGRQAKTTWQGVASPWRNVKTGVPQGSVLGPILFNFFVRDCPVAQPSYADDFTFSRSAVEIADIERGLQSDMDQVVAWAKTKMLSISPEKCSITLFTPDKARQSNTHPQVFIDGKVIPLDKNPKILGVRFDPHFHFNAHATEICKKGRGKLRVMNSLAGTGWGCQKETLLKVYKTYVEPTVNYAAAVWTPNLSESSFNSIQRIQNRALRVATGCHSNTNISHLHNEAKVTQVKDHLEMLSSQVLLSSQRVSHPSHEVVRQPPGPRRMKQTLSSKHSSKIDRFLTNGILDPADYKPALKTLHTEAVANTIAKLDNNPLLDAPPPPIASSETRLNRKQRSTLAQLRSGQCHFLNDYQVLTGRAQSALCPECLINRHTARHLFNCDAAPTDLTIRDLWNNPISVINHLVTLSSFSSLGPTPQPAPPAPRPPLRPPPEPPP